MIYLFTSKGGQHGPMGLVMIKDRRSRAACYNFNVESCPEDFTKMLADFTKDTI